MVLRWLRKVGGLSFDMRIRAFIFEAINNLDKKEYLNIKAAVDKAVKEHLEPDIPDNVIPFKRRA